ncbi:MAG: hypothetical protein OXC26_03775 [Albidovulum sp.]|nr:hypothetical protein [Albidovulum sp.]
MGVLSRELPDLLIVDPLLQAHVYVFIHCLVDPIVLAIADELKLSVGRHAEDHDA